MAAKKDPKKDPNKEKKKPVNTRTIPAIIVLSAALISCAFSLLQNVEFSVFVRRLLFAVLIFGCIGIIVRVILDRYFFNPKKEEEEEEKDKTSEEGDSDENEEDSEKEEESDEDDE